MNAPFKQAERLGRLDHRAWRRRSGLLRFDGSDHLNDLFEYRVEALATRDDLDFDALSAPMPPSRSKPMTDAAL
jgi:type VI secretion system secreted protein VgrG